MTNKTSFIFISLALAICCIVNRGWAQGSLTPPGSPAAMMKTLGQIEPRTPISGAPYTIASSGSYYMTTNLTVTGVVNGIEINADDVMLDMMGFTLCGDGTNSGSGIVQGSPLRNLRIVNGKIINWAGTSQAGILVVGKNINIEDVQVHGNYDGMSTGQGVIIRDCGAYDNLNYGFIANDATVFSSCTAYRNDEGGFRAAYGTTFDSCVASENEKDGFSLGWGCSIQASVASYNHAQGISLDSNCSIINNLCEYNGIASIAAGIFVTGNDNRIDSNNTVVNDYGLKVDGSGNLIIRNSASGNTTNYVIAAGNTDAQTLSPGSGFTATNPWANFEF